MIVALYHVLYPYTASRPVHIKALLFNPMPHAPFLNDLSLASRPVSVHCITSCTYKGAPAHPNAPCLHSHSIAFIAFNAKGTTVAQGKRSPLIFFL